MAEDDLYKLEFLSLVNKITQEIDNHIGINDKTIAEFVINLHEQSKTVDDFKAKLNENGASFSNSLTESVDRLILSLHPKYKKAKSAKAQGKVKAVDDEVDELEHKKRMFPGLALQNKEVPPAVSDDDFLKELGDLVAGKKVRPRPDGVDEPSPKRQRRSPSPRRRSPSPPRGRGSYRNQLDDRPVLYKIYNGRVSGVKEFGAFVQLEGIAGRVEGM